MSVSATVSPPGRLALITGASRGIGRETALQMSRDGWDTILVGRSAEELGWTARACAEHRRATPVVCDIATVEGIDKIQDALEDADGLDALINNAGVGEWSTIETTTSESWRRQIATNLDASFEVTKAALPRLRSRSKSQIVFVASDSSLVGFANRAAYNASKFGVVGLAMSLRAELASEGVDVSIVYFGAVDSYFRDKRPGARPGALDLASAGEALAHVASSFPKILYGDVTVGAAGTQVVGPRSLW